MRFSKEEKEILESVEAGEWKSVSKRVPMLIRWPASLNAERGQHLRQPLELRDVLPTFLNAAGAPIPGACDGMSLLRLARGEEWVRDGALMRRPQAHLYSPNYPGKTT